MTNQSSKIILASTSPYRQTLLKEAGVSFEAVAPQVDETQITAEDPRILAQKRATWKAHEVASRFPGALVIGADQVLSLEGVSFDKAESEEEAALRLAQFAGKNHILHSAYALVRLSKGQKYPEVLVERVVDAVMTMKPLSPEEIKRYIATGEWRGSVGCYKIEGLGRQLLEPFTASMSTIIGLPLKELKADLEDYR